MKVLSLFDGISCGMVALERAGIPVERYVAYEIEPNAIKISQKNYPQDVSPQQRYRFVWTTIPAVLPIPKKDIVVADIIDRTNGENLISEVRFNGREQCIERKDKPVRIGTIGKGGQGERVYSIYGKSVTLTANGGGRGAKTGLYLINDTVRKLTPLEAERCQTLPDNYTEVDGISMTNRLKCIGNGWTVDVIAHILRGIKE